MDEVEFLLKWGTIEEYREDEVRYLTERATALAAGFAESHPLVDIPTRRARIARRVIEKLEAAEGTKDG